MQCPQVICVPLPWMRNVALQPTFLLSPLANPKPKAGNDVIDEHDASHVPAEVEHNGCAFKTYRILYPVHSLLQLANSHKPQHTQEPDEASQLADTHKTKVVHRAQARPANKHGHPKGQPVQRSKTDIWEKPSSQVPSCYVPFAQLSLAILFHEADKKVHDDVESPVVCHSHAHCKYEPIFGNVERSHRYQHNVVHQEQCSYHIPSNFGS
mmetsp:Transcript_54093/g.126363  ORF Transcript_54093/g.126363 Transcript_54093/m.126363 type:complete len:210 (-) Transcript_54093:793-1422(-)